MASDSVLHFGRFEIHPAKRALIVDGKAAAVGARAFDLLLALTERRERLVTKQELMDIVWPGVVVEEHNIAAQMSTLRKLLGADVISTIAGRGYRFVATPSAPSRDQPGRASPAQHNLPEARTRFIGRESALADLARVVPQSRVTTLIGIGGSGKTRLALQFARDHVDAFRGGVGFVDLAPLQAPQRVAAACASVLALSTEPESGLVERVAACIAERDALLVLDNCEHVREGAAAIAGALLACAGTGHIVATSREPLAVAGEQLYPVRALSLPATSELAAIRDADAVRLFVDRARLNLPDFEITAGNAGAIAEICRRLDGIALAIELAAARVTLLSPAEIAARLTDRFKLLGGSASGDLRQRTLLATIKWSHDHLAPAAQRLLRELAVFAGGWTLEAATAVAQCSDDYETLALLTALHDHSLIVVERADKPRYRMLETVRQYAHQQLDGSGEAGAAQTRHAEHFLAFAESVAPRLRGPQQPQAMAQIRQERENLVAAIGWCADNGSQTDPQWALRLFAATARFWLFHDVSLGMRLAADVLRRDGSNADTDARFRTLHALSGMHMHCGNAADAQRWSSEALAMAQRTSNVQWQTHALAAMGSASAVAGDEGNALRYDREALVLAEASGDTLYVAKLCNNIGEIERSRGDFDAAERAYRRSLEVERADGDALSALIVLHNLVRLMTAMGRNEAARSFAVESEARLRNLDEVVLKFELLKVSAGLAASLGEHTRAARWWGAGKTRYLEAGYSDPRIDEQQMAEQAASARRALGIAAFEAAESAGRALSVDDAMRELRQWFTPSS